MLRALQRVHTRCPPSSSSWIRRTQSCRTALIFIARHEPDLFPKPLARAIVQATSSPRVLEVAQGVDGLDLEGADMYHLGVKWESLDARSRAVIEHLIEPGLIDRILEAYEDENINTERR
jgi:hypothetical protein